MFYIHVLMIRNCKIIPFSNYRIILLNIMIRNQPLYVLYFWSLVQFGDTIRDQATKSQMKTGETHGPWASSSQLTPTNRVQMLLSFIPESV